MSRSILNNDGTPFAPRAQPETFHTVNGRVRWSTFTLPCSLGGDHGETTRFHWDTVMANSRLSITLNRPSGTGAETLSITNMLDEEQARQLFNWLGVMLHQQG